MLRNQSPERTYWTTNSGMITAHCLSLYNEDPGHSLPRWFTSSLMVLFYDYPPNQNQLNHMGFEKGLLLVKYSAGCVGLAMR